METLQESSLSEDQQEAFDASIFFMEGDDRFMSIVGPAGSGKSWLMKMVAEEAEHQGWNLSLAAPTHKAVNQLSESAGHDAETIHRVLGAVIKHDYKTGAKELKLTGKSLLKPESFLIIDESSMLQAELLDLIKESAEELDCKVLFIGDKSQLNPVDEKPCIAIDPDQCPWPLFSLTTIHRQAADNPIIKAATLLRTSNPEQLPKLSDDRNGELGIHVMGDEEWTSLMLDRCSHAEVTNDRYVGYTNASVDEVAKRVRQIRYGSDSVNPYLEGELLVVNDRYEYEVRQKIKAGKHKTVVKAVENNSEIVVEKVIRDGDLYVITAGYKGKKVKFRAFESYHKRKAYLGQLAKAARMSGSWRRFYDESNSIADLRSAVSVSVHKSQGSTFRDVFLDCSQISKCQSADERQRLAYVAITRASRAVYLKGDWS